MMRIILSIPHSSTAIPDMLKAHYALTPEQMYHHIDYAVDEIYSVFDHPAVHARASRFVVDVNRARDDLAPGQGVIITTDWDGRTVWKNPPKHIPLLLETYYDPFYEELDTYLAKDVFVWDCHSMDSAGNLGGGDAGTIRPDICIATRGYESCNERIVHSIKHIFEKAGYIVGIDEPYSGKRANILTHIASKGIPGIEFELAKRTYMDETSLILDEERIITLRRLLYDAFTFIEQENH